jgi:7-cyano-7-deazaguanine synthase
MPKGRQPSAVVLLSAGLDSSYNLLMAREKFSLRLALTFDYGQKAAPREIERAAWLAKHYQIPHQVIALPWFGEFTKTALVGDRKVPTGRDIEIDNLAKSHESAKHVWVPNRNGILLNIAAGFAEGLGADVVIPGFNIEEAATFADNTEAFLKALDHSWSFSTNGKVKTHCFSTAMSKTEIVAAAKKLGLPFAKLWPCYLREKTWCGECESCQRFKRALKVNGLSFDELKREV